MRRDRIWGHAADECRRGADEAGRARPHGALRRECGARTLPWRFEPEVAKISLRTGETKTVYYKVANLSDHETSGQAAYNVAPGQAGAFFVKVACFCFEEKQLGPRETAEWPVVFYLDPALEQEEGMRRVEEITLSYSFFATKAPAKSKTSDAAAEKPKS